MTVANLTKVDPLSSGKVFAAFYFALSLIFVPFFLLFAAIGAFAPTRPDQPNPFGAIAGMGFVLLILAPIFYTVIGFIIGVIIGFVYNVATKFTGGFQLTFTEVSPALPPTYPAPYFPRQ